MFARVTPNDCSLLAGIFRDVLVARWHCERAGSATPASKGLFVVLKIEALQSKSFLSTVREVGLNWWKRSSCLGAHSLRSCTHSPSSQVGGERQQVTLVSLSRSLLPVLSPPSSLIMLRALTPSSNPFASTTEAERWQQSQAPPSVGAHWLSGGE